MKAAAKQWLSGRASQPGTLACGLRGPDGKSTCHSLEEICPPAKMEKILGLFEGQRAVVFPGDLSPRWSTWAFEQGQIRFVTRSDGWLLGLMVRHDSDAVPKLDLVSTEFLSLDLED